MSRVKRTGAVTTRAENAWTGKSRARLSLLLWYSEWMRPNPYDPPDTAEQHSRVAALAGHVIAMIWHLTIAAVFAAVAGLSLAMVTRAAACWPAVCLACGAAGLSGCQIARIVHVLRGRRAAWPGILTQLSAVLLLIGLLWTSLI